MMKVLINAYAVSPSWGSEQGVGWHWITSIAQYCEVVVITESEFREDIDAALRSLPQAGNITFHYIPVSQRVRNMCWNQGNWLFYLPYKLWQRKALKLARKIVASQHIDVIHQLNMVGFREPGLLWRIKDIPYVWGPVGGTEQMPLRFIQNPHFYCKSLIKNILNFLQLHFDPWVNSAVKHSDAFIAAGRASHDYISDKRPDAKLVLLNETGCEASLIASRKAVESDPLDILWVGKIVRSKCLDIAIRTLGALSPEQKSRIRFRIAGAGPEENKCRRLARELGVEPIWLGKIPNSEVKQLMRASSLFFFTSIMEATSTVVLEAVENSLTILCFDACGFGPIVDATIGMKVPLTTPEEAVRAFSEKIAYALEHPDALRAMSAGCPAKMKTLTWDYKARRTLEIYDSICKRPASI